MFRLLKNGDVYAPEHIGKADILICNDKIVDIAEHIDFDYPGTEVVDLEGRKVIPGVIDQHIHVTGGGGESGFTSKVTEVGLSDLVRGGVCTVVGVLGTDSISRNVESLLAKVKALNEEGLTVVSGGRVLCVVGLGESIAAAQKSAYAAARQVKFDGMQMRSDIGYRALNR